MILNILKTRFEKNMNRHKDLDWSKLQAKLEKKQVYQKKSIKKARKRENSEPTKQTRVKGTGFKPEFI